jgi:RNA recognition motif-containing protein
MPRRERRAERAARSRAFPRRRREKETGVKKIYVGNLPYSATETEIRDVFGQFGTVHSVSLITDRETGRPRGFGFVEMDDSEADAAIGALDGQDFSGRTLRVNQARERRAGGGRDRHSGGNW